tara:strand:+ start:360 stop:722 length:363 start_codon:yes stop_codon:yes gene_type:complete
MDGQYQNKVDILPDLEMYRYENIFKLYQQGEKNFYFYNILKKIKLPEDINEEIFDFVKYPAAMPLTTLSFRVYGTTQLWWLILIVNGISNPQAIPSGVKIRIVKKAYLKTVLESIKQQLQ